MGASERAAASCRRWAVRSSVVAALAACTVLPCHAVESDTDPQAAADPDYAAGRKAIEARSWNIAIESFSSAAMRAPDNADIQNYLGYAYRNAAQLDSAFTHYKRALELNPRHRGAHEYIGEAYLMAGDLASARKHLEELRKICLLPCQELKDLEKAVAEYRGKPRTGAR
jgi:Flp pilus assembly protein TadD